MTGQDDGFSQAVARFSAEVDTALTRARRAAREAKAQSADFRRRTGELAAEAATATPRGVGRAGPDAAAKADDEDFSQHRVLVDVGTAEEPVEDEPQHDFPDPPVTDGIDSPIDEATRPSDDDEDFSQQRILLDTTVESYRPDGMLDAVFEPSDPENPRSDAL